MQVRVEDIEAFLLTAELRSFNRAADELNITQSALSRRLQKLEAALGAKLLDRTSRVVALSVIGEEFLPTAKRIVAEFENSLGEMRDLIEKRSGSISVSTNLTIAHTVYPKILSVFHQRHPGIRVRVIEDSTPAVIDAVSSGAAEFGIGSAPSHRSRLEFDRVIDDPVVFVAPADHPLAGRDRIAWGEIDPNEFIAPSTSSGTFRLLSGHLGDLGTLSGGQFVAAHSATILGLVHAGLGVTAIPRMAALNRPELNLRLIELAEPTISRSLGFLSRSGRSLSPGAASLRAVAQEILQDLGRAEGRAPARTKSRK